MYQLNEQQIDFIINDISARGVEMETLQQDLADHVCCIIENNLEENGDFESFYQKTIKTFYKNDLTEIEEETLLVLTYKNYYAMKKTMINSGIASAVLFTAGSFFKFMHWPGASVLILLGMFIGTLIFLPIFFMFKKNETVNSKEKLVLGIGVINGMFFSLYVLFKVFHWPGANLLWFFTLGIFALIFIPLYFFSGIKNPTTKLNTITTTIILIMLAGVFFLQTRLMSSKQFYLAKTYNYIQYEDLLLKLQATKSANQNNEIEKLANEINQNCNEIKTMIISDAIGTTSIPKDFEEKQITFEEVGLSSQFNIEENGYSKILKLKDQINTYNSIISSHKQAIQMQNEIARMIDKKLLQQSNFNLLYALNQIQLITLQNKQLFTSEKEI
ncbi:MAG: hypothetical protein JSU07_04890 [Bacteroidetes bacterium]|nr:hypothetical protein [Bacteroidota bacterium]